MPLAFVLINTELGATEDVLNRLHRIPNVKDAYMVYGVYDIIARIEAESMAQLQSTISTQIRVIDNIRSTLTTIVMEED
jgi:DNA-binding Lrp family transcriptional regulator